MDVCVREYRGFDGSDFFEMAVALSREIEPPQKIVASVKEVAATMKKGLKQATFGEFVGVLGHAAVEDQGIRPAGYAYAYEMRTGRWCCRQVVVSLNGFRVLEAAKGQNLMLHMGLALATGFSKERPIFEPNTVIPALLTHVLEQPGSVDPAEIDKLPMGLISLNPTTYSLRDGIQRLLDGLPKNSA